MLKNLKSDLSLETDIPVYLGVDTLFLLRGPIPPLFLSSFPSIHYNLFSCFHHILTCQNISTVFWVSKVFLFQTRSFPHVNPKEQVLRRLSRSVTSVGSVSRSISRSVGERWGAQTCWHALLRRRKTTKGGQTFGWHLLVNQMDPVQRPG